MDPVTAAAIDFVESGAGPSLLFVPGSYSTPAAWRPIQRLLPPAYRMAATSLCGYGATAERRGGSDTAMRHQAEVIAAAAARLPGPVHLVGHSFGGTVALAAALSRRFPVASLALFEANPLDLLRSGGSDALHRDSVALSRRFAAAVEAGDPEAPGLIIDFWGAAGDFAAMPEQVRDYCRKTAPANVLDWHTCLGFAAGPLDYAQLGLPVLLVRGERANPAMLAITAALQAALPDARLAVVPGAGHFLITSHAPACAALLGGFLESLSGPRSPR